MSFNTAITGLKSASTMLDVTGNNIANVATTGFKSSRTEFADIYATSVVGAGSSNTPGSGVTVAGISQDFSAGTIEFTNNNLDLAINGSGFFQLRDEQGGVTYTRAGAFELNKDGQIVSKSGRFLQGFGLDAENNRLPIGNLQVDQKESRPKATEKIDLSFNIDARADSSKLLPVYNKDEPGSFTYTTTVRSFDSLGNEQTIKFNFAEQRPVRQQYAFDVGPGSFTISGVELDASDFDNGVLDPTDPNGNRAALLAADPRIDINSVTLNAANRLSFELIASETDTGGMRVTDADPVSPTVILPAVDGKRPANETRTYTLALPGPLDPAASGSIKIGGVDVEISLDDDERDVLRNIKDLERRIVDRNPDIEAIFIDTNNNTLQIKFRADSGLIDLDAFQPEITVNTGSIDFGDTTIAAGETRFAETDPNGRVIGDNSYIGKYRLYGYLNNTDLLDLGKSKDPGAGAGTEKGPILISFTPSGGLLDGINVFGEDQGIFLPGAQVPKITIRGADPADAETIIELDLTNSTQFASASIVKNQQQDGYAKGDLIGVTFSPTGEMVASFSNGQNQSLGIVAFATFENQDGLQPAGNTEWIATLASGNAILNPPGTGLNGTLRSAALEQSNVDLSTELVNLIQAQRNFQASSKTLETANNITQTILNI